MQMCDSFIRIYSVIMKISADILLEYMQVMYTHSFFASFKKPVLELGSELKFIKSEQTFPKNLYCNHHTYL